MKSKDDAGIQILNYTMHIVLLINQKDYEVIISGKRAGIAACNQHISLSRKRLTFAWLCCYNVVLGVYRGRSRRKWNDVACRMFTVVIHIFSVQQRIRQDCD